VPLSCILFCNFRLHLCSPSFFLSDSFTFAEPFWRPDLCYHLIPFFCCLRTRELVAVRTCACFLFSESDMVHSWHFSISGLRCYVLSVCVWTDCRFLRSTWKFFARLCLALHQIITIAG
jgi:hypothetical protein